MVYTTRTRHMTPTAPRGTLRYSAAHKKRRKQLLADLERNPGQPCSRCGLPMFVSQRLHLDHSDDGATWRGLAHASCNLRAGQAITTIINRARNAQRKQPRWGPQTGPYNRW